MTTATGNSAGDRARGTANGEPRCLAEGRGCGGRWERRRSPHRGGFTLIEMLAVIVLIAIGATVAAVSLHGRGRGALDAAAQGIAAGLRDTRTRAMAHGKPEWFTLDLKTHTYQVPGREPHGLPARATLKATTADVGKPQPGIARIGYFPDGSSSGGHIILSEDQRALRVDVDWLTGAVTVTDKVEHE